MASYMKRKIVCQCCMEQYEANVLKGLYLSGPTGLDTKPYHPAIYDRVVFCPHCGYAASGIYSKVDEKVRQFMETDEFRAVRYHFSWDDTAKKLYMAARLAEAAENYKESGLGYLKAYWYFSETQMPDVKEVLEKAMENLDQYLKQEQDLTCAVIYVDLLRQAQRFEEAGETIHFLEPYVNDERELFGILQLEKKLIAARDCTEHKTSEVK